MWGHSRQILSDKKMKPEELMFKNPSTLIIRRLLMLMGGLLCSLVVLEGYEQVEFSKYRDYFKEINVAARQRMLSQRIAHLVVSSKEKKYLVKDVAVIWQEMKIAHNDLLYGNSEKGIPKPISAEVEKSLLSLHQEILEIDQAISCYGKKCQPYETLIPWIEQHMEKYLWKMDMIVEVMESYASRQMSFLSLIQAVIFAGVVALVLWIMFTQFQPLLREIQLSFAAAKVKNRFADLMESVAIIGSWELDLETNMTQWSDEVYRIHGLEVGLKVSEIQGINFYAPKERPRLKSDLEKCISTGERVDEEYEFFDQSGQHKWVRVIAERELNTAGEVIKLVGVFQDVSDRKRFVQELEESKKYLELAVDGANLGIWDWYLTDDSVRFDQNWAKLLGLEVKDINMSLETWESRVHTKDLASCHNDIQNYISGNSKTYQNIHRMKHANGEWIYVLAKGKFSEWDDNGNPLRFTGTHMDITEEKIREAINIMTSNVRLSFIESLKNKDVVISSVMKEINSFFETEASNVAELSIEDGDDLPQLLSVHSSGLDFEKSEEPRESLNSKKVVISQEFFKDILSSNQPTLFRSFRDIKENFGVALAEEFSFLGFIPISSGGKCICILTIAKTDGYVSDKYFRWLKPFLNSVGEMIVVSEIESRYRKRQQEAEIILEATGLGIWSYFPQSNELVWDESMYQLYGVDPSEFGGHFDAWEGTLHPDDKDRSAEEFTDFLSDSIEEFDAKFRILTGENKVKHVRARARIIEENDRGPVKVMGVNWDVSDEESVRNALEKQKDLAFKSAKLASIGFLAAGVGHEINNPLAVAKGFIETLQVKWQRGDLDTEKAESYFQKISIALNRIAKIVGGLRVFSRKDVDERKEFDAFLALTEAVSMVQEIYAKEGVELSSDIEFEENSVFLDGDRGSILQVLMNLFSNAKDASLNKSKRTIHLSSRFESEKLIIEVRDNGSGISNKNLEHIFDPFFTTKDVNQGTGIGLSIAFQIIQDHQGKIDVSSNLGVGTTFTLAFAASNNSPETEATIEVPERLFPFRVLVVDDEVELREILTNLFESFGFEVETAKDGKDAFDALKKQPGAFDLVVSDLQMPRMSGQDLVLSSYGQLPAPPKFILITGGVNVDFETLETEMGSKVSGYFYKPFERTVIQSVLEEVFPQNEKKVA